MSQPQHTLEYLIVTTAAMVIVVQALEAEFGSQLYTYCGVSSHTLLNYREPRFSQIRN